MSLFQRLNTAIDEEYTNGELPDNLVQPLRQVSENAANLANDTATVELLLRQLQAFEPYCDCGCFAEGYNATDIIKTLNKLGIEAADQNI